MALTIDGIEFPGSPYVASNALQKDLIYRREVYANAPGTYLWLADHEVREFAVSDYTVIWETSSVAAYVRQ